MPKTLPKIVGAPPANWQPTTFYVYENWTNDYTCIHRAGCYYCNDGEGINRPNKPAVSTHGKWHKPKKSLKKAMKKAKKLDRAKVHLCAACQPGKERKK